MAQIREWNALTSDGVVAQSWNIDHQFDGEVLRQSGKRCIVKSRNSINANKACRNGVKVKNFGKKSFCYRTKTMYMKEGTRMVVHLAVRKQMHCSSKVEARRSENISVKSGVARGLETKG